MNRRHGVLLGLLVAAAWLALFGDKTPHDTPGSDVVPATATRGERSPARLRAPAEARPAAMKLAAGQAPASPEVMPLLARDQLIPVVAHDRPGRDLFPALSWQPPPARAEQPARPVKPLPPVAPPVPFVYLGKKLESGQWEAYLGQGENVYIARAGMTLGGMYQVEAIDPPTLRLLYLPLKQSQTLSIGGAQ